jgi:hypothetical protein
MQQIFSKTIFEGEHSLRFFILWLHAFQDILADRYAQYTRLQPVGDPQTISPATDPEHQAQALYRRIQPSNDQQNIKNYVCCTHFSY